MSWLCHHGVKGQRWGVRNGPPYPIEDKTLRKGQRLSSVSFYTDSKKYKSNGRMMYTYNPDDEWDSAVYKGPFAYYKMKTGMNWVYEHQYEVAQDLRMPTSKERLDEFISLYATDKVKVTRDLKNVKAALERSDVDTSKANGVDLGNLQTESDYKAAYEIFNHAMENVSKFASTRKYMNIMSKKYDAMVDDNNQGIYNDVHDPIIIFRADTALKEIGNARILDIDEMVDNYNKVAKARGNKGVML